MYNLTEYSKNYRKTKGSTEMNKLMTQTILIFQIKLYSTQSLLNTREVLQGVLIVLMQKILMQKVLKLVILLMMKTNLVKKKLKLLFH